MGDRKACFPPLRVRSLPFETRETNLVRAVSCESCRDYQRAPNPPEFAQPRLSRAKGRSSPARGYKFGCVCSYMASHEDAEVMTGHIGTNTPNFVPPRWGRPPFGPTQTGLCKFGWVWSSLRLRAQKNNKLNFLWPKMACLGTSYFPQPQPPPRKSLCGPLFCVLSQKMRHTNFCLGGGSKMRGFG